MTEDIMQQKNAYGLTELVELINNKKIDIPTIQRGFVWSIHQIEIFGILFCGDILSEHWFLIRKRRVFDFRRSTAVNVHLSCVQL